MRKYVLADERARANVNLEDYSDTIANAVLDVVSEDEVEVYVCKDGYYMDFRASKTEEDRIKELLNASELGKYRSDDGSIFTYIDVLEEY